MSSLAVDKLSYTLKGVMTVGERIAHRLRALDLSQAELARRVGLKQPTINGLIRGNARSSTHLHEIARELRTTTAYLSGETDDPDSGLPTDWLTTEEREILELLRELESGDRKSLLQLARSLAQNAASPTLHDRQLAYGTEGA